MIERPPITADEEVIEHYVRTWVYYAAENGFDSALQELDTNEKVSWSEEFLDKVTFDHFSDGEHCRITNPKLVKDLRVEAYRFDDGSGFAVDHDLPLNNNRSDFTAQFEFKVASGEWRITLEDVHVL